MNDCGHLRAGERHEPVGPAGIRDRVEQLTAKDVMQYGVVSIDRKEPVHKAVSLLLDKNLSGLPVTNYGQLEGMLSERDVLRLVHKGQCLPGPVGDYMTQSVTSFDVDDLLPTLFSKLAGSAIRRVPVLLNQQTLAGIVTRTDLIRAYKDGFRPSTPVSNSRCDGELRAEDVMKRGLLTVTADAPLYEAMDIIAGHHVTGLPVVDEAMHVVGIITEKDVLDCCIRPLPADSTVAAFMTTDVVTFDRKTSLDLICERLVEKDFQRVPIVDQGRLVGIISRSDILKSKAPTLMQPSTRVPGRACRMSPT